jgi:hypothetical protein
MELQIKHGDATGSRCLQCGRELQRGTLHRCSSSVRGYAYVVDDNRRESVIALDRVRETDVAPALASAGRPAA